MFNISFLHKKNKYKEYQSTTIFWWKVCITTLLVIVIMIVVFSYGIFSKTDQDPFVADTTNAIGGVKQYDTNKIQKIKQYFDEKEAIYNAVISTKLQINDPSI